MESAPGCADQIVGFRQYAEPLTLPVFTLAGVPFLPSLSYATQPWNGTLLSLSWIVAPRPGASESRHMIRLIRVRMCQQHPGGGFGAWPAGPPP